MDKIDEVLTRGVIKILPSKEGLAKLLRKGKIRLYNGIDPTSPNIHLGNTVPLLKLKQFQDLGHEVILLVGTFTAQIGDPSGHTEARKAMTSKQVAENIKTYQKQAAKILDFSKTKLVFNGDWLTDMTFKDVIRLSSNFTFQQIIERDLFQERIKNNRPIYFNELLYPFAQGYDSVHLNVDLEIGATEQEFNMLAGRTLQKIYNHKEKFIMTLPLIPGSDGRKMSKSWGNVINIIDSPNEMYGKLMAVRDDLIILYFEACTQVPLQWIKEQERLLQSGKVNPMNLKKQLASEIVKMYHGELNAKNAEKEFERVFQKRGVPKGTATVKLKAGDWNLVDLLVTASLTPSRSEAKRLIEQGSIDIDGKRFNGLTVKVKENMVIKVGKRKFAKIQIK